MVSLPRETIGPQPAPARPRGDPLMEAFRLKTRVIAALVLRDTRTHFGETRIGYLWALLEPILHLLVLSTVFIFVLRRHIPIGGSYMLFFFTGLVPYFLYYKLASYMAGGISANKALMNLPPVKPLDVMFARGILEGATYLFVAFIMFLGLAITTDDAAVPADPLQLMTAIVAIVGLGFGLGMINSLIGLYVLNWRFLFQVFASPLYLLSGVFFDVSQVPQPLRDYMLYNPLVHCIAWFRSGFYPWYGQDILDRSYVVYWALTLLVLGFGAERVMRRKMLEPT
jgi:capsular polysaccharide transport system permease protein